jgi:hypothetical protein
VHIVVIVFQDKKHNLRSRNALLLSLAAYSLLLTMFGSNEMPSIVIEVSDEDVAKLARQAKAKNMDVAGMLAQMACRTAALAPDDVWDPSFDEDDLADIQMGMQELSDGKGIPHKVAMNADD